jgi:azurin
MRSTTPVITTMALLLGLASTLPAAAAREIKLEGNDKMQYSITKIEAKPGETLTVSVSTTSSMAKAEMAHNFVLLAKGANVDAFVMAAAMARKTQHIPAAKKADMLAYTALAGAGETVKVTFDAPKEPGEYTFICSFPGHYAAGMKGVLVVK